MQSERPSSNSNRRVSTLAGPCSIFLSWFCHHLARGSACATGAPLSQHRSASTICATFDNKMAKDGYWLGGSGYGYGYPMDGYGYGLGIWRRPNCGYRTRGRATSFGRLLPPPIFSPGKANSSPCEDVLAATREYLQFYVADMRSGRMPPADLPGWRQLQIAAAKPVTSMNTSFRSDELVGTDVRSPQNEALGSVEDIVMSPKSDKIAYLVIARGGIFGIDEKYVPVPWEAFKIIPEREAARTRHHQERLGRGPAGEQ